jgi:hypothetical protein
MVFSRFSALDTKGFVWAFLSPRLITSGIGNPGVDICATVGFSGRIRIRRRSDKVEYLVMAIVTQNETHNFL